MPQTRTLAAELSIAFCQQQVRWLEGLVHAARGETAAARSALREAHAGFVALDEIGHAAVISLDLALIHVERHEIDEALHLASEALPLFKALRIYREGLAALHLLREALRTRTLTRATIRQLHTTLRCLVPMLRMGA